MVSSIQKEGVFIEYDRVKLFKKVLSLKKCSHDEKLSYTQHMGEIIQIIGV